MDHVVQSLAGCHHGHAGGPLDAAVEQDGLVGILKQKFPQLGLQIFGMIAIDRLDAERLGQLDVIGVGIPHGQVPLPVEQTLPVLDHHLTLVVEDDHLDGDALLGHRLELREGHVERSVAVDADADGLGVGQLGPDGVAEAHAHGPERARAEHLPWLGPRNVLGGDHLVDADARGEEAVVHPAGGKDDLVHLLDDVLGGHFRAGLLVLGAVVGLDLDGLGTVLGYRDGILLFELGLVLEPRSGGGGGLDFGTTTESQLLVDGPEEIDTGGMHEEVRFDLLGMLGLAYVDVDDTTASLHRGPSGFRQKAPEGTGNAIVEPRPNVDEEVALLHHKVGGGVAVHAQHVERQGMTLVEHPHGVEGGGDGDLEGFGERQKFVGGVVTTLSGDDDRLARLADQVEHFGQDLGARCQVADGGGGRSIRLDLGGVDGVGGMDIELVGFVSTGSGAEGRAEGEVGGGDVKGQTLRGISEVEGAVSLPVGAGVGGEADEWGVERGRLGGGRGHVLSTTFCGGNISQTGRELLDEIVRNDLILQILGQVNKHRTRPTIPCHVEGIVHHEGHLGRRSNLIRPLGDGPREIDGGTGLEGRLGSKGGGLSAQDDEGNTVAHGIGEGGDEIGDTRARRRDDDAGLHLAILPPGCGFGKSLADVTRAALVGVGDPSNLAGVAVLVSTMTGMLPVKLIEEGQDSAAGVAVDDRDVVLDELGVDDGRGGFAGVLRQVGRGGGAGLVAGQGCGGGGCSGGKGGGGIGGGGLQIAGRSGDDLNVLLDRRTKGRRLGG